MSKGTKNDCEYCQHYYYDDETECYACDVELDMDEYERFVTDSVSDCPYYQGGDEYTLVRHQN